MQTIRRTLLFIAVQLMVFSIALPAFADQDPLRLAFINASQKGGGDAYDTIMQFLEASDDIKVKDSEKIWDAAEEEGVSRKDFRNSKRRKASTREFRRVMKSLNLEAIMILDVFSKGRKLQLVVIGPNGEEVADVREDIKRGKVSKSEAKKILKDAFAELVPQVKEFRDNGGWDAVDDEPEEEEEEEEVAQVDDEEEDGDDESGDDANSLKAMAVAAASSEYGLEPGVSFRFGALVGSRSFSMESEGECTLDHKSPFVGVDLELSSIFSVFSGGSAAIGGSVFVAYAPFTTLFDESEEFASDYARLVAQLVFTKAFSEEVALDIFGGVQAWSVTIDKNPHYTGNRYLGARLGGSLSYAAGPVVISGGAGLLPTFDINNSDGAFGTADLTFGLEGQVSLSFQVTDAIEARIGYNLTSISPDYPDAVNPDGISDPITSSDVIHSGAITMGYRL